MGTGDMTACKHDRHGMTSLFQCRDGLTAGIVEGRELGVQKGYELGWSYGAMRGASVEAHVGLAWGSLASTWTSLVGRP